MNIVNFFSGALLASFLLILSATFTQAETTKIQPSMVTAVAQSCDLNDLTAECASAKDRVATNLFATADTILSLNISADRLLIGLIKMANSRNSVRCYYLKVYPQYAERIGTHCP